jgi:hypothetical protein
VASDKVTEQDRPKGALSMASLNEAEKAREQQSEYLRNLGAHAIAVEPVKARPRKEEQAGGGFVVVAYFDRKPAHPLPESLEVKSGKKRMKVPLMLRLAPKFQLE